MSDCDQIPIHIVKDAINSLEERSCDCDLCKEMCNHPCWGTPEEIQSLMNRGYANKLMRDWWVGNFSGRTDPDEYPLDVSIICPANVGDEGSSASSWRSGKCTFQMRNGLCEIHSLGKPVEGRKFTACDQKRMYENGEKEPEFRLHEYVARLWDTDEGREVVENWKRLRGDIW